MKTKPMYYYNFMQNDWILQSSTKIQQNKPTKFEQSYGFAWAAVGVFRSNNSYWIETELKHWVYGKTHC